jgi:hypothetical protein
MSRKNDKISAILINKVEVKAEVEAKLFLLNLNLNLNLSPAEPFFVSARLIIGIVEINFFLTIM